MVGPEGLNASVSPWFGPRRITGVQFSQSVPIWGAGCRRYLGHRAPPIAPSEDEKEVFIFDKLKVMALFKRFMESQIPSDTFVKELTKLLVEEMGCTRASLWIYANPLLRDSIECLSLYDRTDAAWTDGTVLREDDFAPYFEAMRRDHLIVAAEAREHPVTACVNDIDFEPLGFYSLLDVGVHLGAEPFGLFCCENTTDVMNWNAQHVDFLRQVGTLLGFALCKAKDLRAVPA
jgi:GAF domain-containing protein